MENTSMTSLAPHFESILDTLSDGVFISDAEGTTLFVNKMYETLTGLRQGEIRGKNIRTLVQQGIFDKVVNPQIVETGKSATHVQQLANGKRLVLTGYPVFDDKGQLCLVVTFARDITVLTQLQEEMTAQKKLIEQFHDRLAFLAREQTRELVPVFESREMKEVMSLVERFASSDATVLILGESGTGKELFAQSIHNASPRASRPFVAVNCGCIRGELAASEFFGHVQGAFTDAKKDTAGYFETAKGGTLFLDEIGNMPPEMQTLLLRVLQERVYCPVGSRKELEADVRILSATNEDMERAIREGRFREDLYYRLAEFEIRQPSLSECPEDILPLADFFREQHSEEIRVETSGFTEQAKISMLSHSWPGNVRELDNRIRRAVLLALSPLLTHKDLNLNATICRTGEKCKKGLMEEAEEKELIRKILEECGGKISRVARMLGISRPTLYKKMERYGLR